MRRRSWPVLVSVLVVVAVAARALVLLWSPLPATLDGFRYARLARLVVETGSVLGTDVESDELVTTLVFAIGGAVTATRPLYLAQPLVSILGGVSVLSALVLVRETGRTLAWSPHRTKTAAVAAAVGLACSGLYLRRTGVPDEEALGLLVLPLFALAAYRFITGHRASWWLVFAVLALAYPPLHNLSSVVAAFTLTALVAVTIQRAPERRVIRTGVGSLGLFWAYFFGYYGLAPRLGLELTYSGLFRDNLGVLVAWLCALVFGLLWVQTTGRRVGKTVVGLGLGSLFLIVGLNVFTPIFPGTIETPVVVLGMVGLYLVPVGLAITGLDTLWSAERGSPLVVALLFGPLALTWFMLTTELTPAFFAAVLRTQVHMHIAIFGLAGVGAVALAQRRQPIGRVLLVGLVVASVLTAPLAFIHLDTATAPRTIHASEFEAVSFASTGGGYSTDQRLSRVGPLYYGDDVAAETGATHQWLRGGDPPSCLTVAQRAWTEGAHFYPLPSERLAENRLEHWVTRNNLVYSVGGTTDTYVVSPTGAAANCA